MAISEVSNFLARLPPKISALLFENATRIALPGDRVLFQAGDTGNGCYRLEEGLLKVVMSSPKGNERNIAILGPGSIIGELSVLDGLPRSASVIAIRDCSLQFVSKESFDRCANEHPEVFKHLTAILASRLREADAALAATSFLTVKGRLARAFLDLADHLGRKSSNGQIVFTHKISQSDLAAMAGIARENVSRTLAEWKSRKIVDLTDRYYCIANVAALKNEIDNA